MCETLLSALDTQQRAKDKFTDSMEFTFSFEEKDNNNSNNKSKFISLLGQME